MCFQSTRLWFRTYVQCISVSARSTASLSHHRLRGSLDTRQAPERLRVRAEQSNGMMMAVYLASMTRAVVSLHNLIENKEARVWHEKKQAAAVEAATKKETDTAAAAVEAADEASKENSSAQKKA